MIAEGRDYIATAWWVSFSRSGYPGDGPLLQSVRRLATDALDPKLRQM